MSNDVIEPDPVVETALRLLPIPDHEADFWANLSTALDAEPAPVAPEGTAERTRVVALDGGSQGERVEPSTTTGTPAVVDLLPVHHLGVVPPALRRPSNVILSAVAVAAAVMVVVAGVSLVRDRSGDDSPSTELAESPDTSPDSSGAPLAATDGTTSTAVVSTLVAPGSDAASAAVVDWLNALGQGDMDAAWAALSPRSQDHWGSREAFEGERSGLAEGYGAWSAAEPDAVLVTSLVDGGADGLVVVTMVGAVHQEGAVQHRADAFPVRMVDGKAHLELWAEAGEIEFVIPEPHPAGGKRPVVTGDELIVVVPDGVEPPVLRLDDDAPVVCGESTDTELTELEQASGQRCAYRPSGGLPAGERVLTVAFGAAGSKAVSAQSVLFEAA